MIALSVVLLIVALVCFILAAFGALATRVNLVAAGLACWVLAEILRAGLVHVG